MNRFILGFPCTWEAQIFLFSFFSEVYALTLIGNLCIICAVWWDHHLHSPMYILLANFPSWRCGMSLLLSDMLANFLSETRPSPSLAAFCSLLLLLHGHYWDLLLVTMAFDRYLAICRPLLPHCHDSSTLHQNGSLLLGVWLFLFSPPSLSHLPASFLWPQYYWSLPMWPRTPPEVVLRASSCH